MLFEQIAKNKRHTILLFLGFFFVMALVGAALGYFMWGNITSGILVTSVGALVYAMYMFSQSSEVVMSMNNAQEITEPGQAPELWHIVEDMAMVAKVPMPRVFIINDPSPNAFATGNNPENAAVAATTGIMSRLSRAELEAVMAHEMAHVKNYDIRLQTLAVALTAAIAMVGNFATNFWVMSSRRDDNRESNIIGIVLSIAALLLAPIAATIVQLAISRNREYLADAGAVELTRNPQAMIDALEKISQSEPMRPENVSDSSAGLYIGDPLKKGSAMNSLFDTHPPMESRIAALRAM
jgi:heat shock protein HtpX